MKCIQCKSLPKLSAVDHARGVVERSASGIDRPRLQPEEAQLGGGDARYEAATLGRLASGIQPSRRGPSVLRSTPMP